MQAEPAKKYSKLKLILAGIGVVYLVGAGVWAGQAYLKSRAAAKQPNLAAHPELARQTMIDREIGRYSEQLGLTDDQKKQVHDILDQSGMKNAEPGQAMRRASDDPPYLWCRAALIFRPP